MPGTHSGGGFKSTLSLYSQGGCGRRGGWQSMKVEMDVTMAFAFVIEPGPSAISPGWPHLTTVGYDGHLIAPFPSGNGGEPCLR